MFLPSMEVSLRPRPEGKLYNIQMNQNLLDILKLIFEFKIATAWHIARFISHTDQSKYLHLKLRRMWQAGYLESLEIYAGTRLGMPIYYMLSKQGLNTLREYASYDKIKIQSYPTVVGFLSSGLFRHEAYIVELASLEAMNNTNTLHISFTGEINSMNRENRSDKNIEVLTPDYTVTYTKDTIQRQVYTEFERTNKSPAAMMRKIDRYALYFGIEKDTDKTLRIIFQTENMEKAFWLNLFLNKPGLLQYLQVVTTNVSILQTPEQFIKPVYAEENSTRLTRDGRMVVEIQERIKLYDFL